ncbi:MAG: hypothetical protein U9Q39_06710 [Pseudomonadota bacterium]|nr:hypothetical protein [Pseudomonadota bacterium]
MIARKPGDHVLEIDRQIERLFIDRQMFVPRHFKPEKIENTKKSRQGAQAP